ncbi:GAF domain-containing SpoIIE family protein phosphatase [Bacillus alkalicellulosilyticus]|uniref:GAF domain-containing SpoIIE family protein phosphatase n=1 Tax=Alkalihalobacterium alkalicellulosilyticum TaxID=1912214 RepID=UPI000998B189|nr:GAF domain-containing SpoIIE family protein phosphatase [Bacillus alkalicellulosilyticus]
MLELLSKFEENAQTVLLLMKRTVGAKTFFIASTQQNRFKILQVINEEGGCNIPPSVDEPVEKSYCNIVANSKKPLLIKDTSKSELVRNLEVTNIFTIGSYLGVPIFLENGSVFGTLCALDPDPYKLKAEDIPILEGFSQLISSEIKLEEKAVKLKKYEMQTEIELELARKVQQSVLNAPYHDNYLDIKYIYTPSTQLSGDVCSWYKIKEGLYGVIVLDVMGHGVSSALIGMAISPILEDIITTCIDPDKVMEQLNKELFHLFNDKKEILSYVTGIYVTLDFNNNKINFLNAGHPPAVLVNSNQISFIDKGSIPLGIFETLKKEVGEFPLEEETEIILYTDGLMDFLHKNKEHPGDTIAKHYQLAKREQKTTINYFRELIEAEETHEDDICLVSVKVLDSL